MMSVPLPIDGAIAGIRDALRRARAVVVTAAPGAGKTTRVPPALTEDGTVLLLQPRRVAARAIARRIAQERGWTLGDEVGWQVRFDRRASDRTRLLVATEGVLTAFVHTDPLLSAWRTVIVDEFHERSVHADLGVAFAKQAWLAREDLRLVVMSATLDAERVSAWLGHCPVVAVPGRLFPVTRVYRPGAPVAGVAAEAVTAHGGAVLCFLPGAADIERTRRELGERWPVFPLHGRLDADAQDAALCPSQTPRIVLATNIAETTVTVPDVTAVVDTGIHKVARYDAGCGLDTLVAERVSSDSADQRAGRAGRTQAGVVYRLWDARDRLRPHREAEIARVDLAAVVLDVMAWGGHPNTFDWFEAPPAWRIDAALTLLRRLGAIDASDRLTADGRQFRQWPLHPRLARLLLSAGGTVEAARVAVALSDGLRPPAHDAGDTRASDLEIFADGRALLPAAREAAEHLVRRAARVPHTAASLAQAVLAAYPDRVARRRPGQRDVYLLSSGTGAVRAKESGVRDAEYVVAIDVTTDARPGRDAWIRLASSIDAEWLAPTHQTIDHELDRSGTVRAVRRDWYDAIVLRDTHVPPDPDVSARLLLEQWRAQPRREADLQLEARLRCAGADVTLEALAAMAVVGARAGADVNLAAVVPDEVRRALKAMAPETIRMPSGRDLPLDYRADGSVVVSVKLQEVFGLADTPLVGVHRVPVTFELLAPNQRPVQVTRDLRSFWTRGYPEVRKALRGRYPKHPWPEDPWTATPTHRTTRASSPPSR